ncbi:MAG TPA: cytochrome P450, partial [Trueperaceae bacterium]
PAIRTRKQNPKDDVISHLLEQGYSGIEILTECITYAAAGMATTREFISASAWHLLENPTLRQQYLAADEIERHAILHELLRLEPVVGHLLRRTQQDLHIHHGNQTTTIPAGSLVDIHIHNTNADPAAVGEDPERYCPHRNLAQGVQPYAMSFGDGHHRCPGSYIAIQETDIFLTRLLALPNLRMQTPPELSWNELVKGYEIRGFHIELA